MPPFATRRTTRPSSATGLPWTIVATDTDPEGDLRGFVQRRRLIVIGLGALALLVVAASYLIGRAVSRELAAVRLQSDFVSAVSHEFRTPLTALAQFTEILGEHEDAPIEKRRTFHQAQARATRRLTRLVESLLDFGRMEAGARPYQLEPIDAAEVTEGVVRDFRQDVAPAGFTVSYNGPTGRATATRIGRHSRSRHRGLDVSPCGGRSCEQGPRRRLAWPARCASRAGKQRPFSHLAQHGTHRLLQRAQVLHPLREYVPYLMSVDKSFCAECGGEVRLFSESDWRQFNESMAARKPKGGRPRKDRGRKRESD